MRPDVVKFRHRQFFSVLLKAAVMTLGVQVHKQLIFTEADD